GSRQISVVDGKRLSREEQQRLRWTANVLLQLTPACTLVAFSRDAILARVGFSGGESNDPELLTLALAKAKEGKGKPVVLKRAQGSGGGEAERRVEGDSNLDEPVMRLLPSACRQGVACVMGETDSGLTAVLLGSTLGGVGVFSSRDLDWFTK
ncbi:unnamed protein product, partial [Choristocarpus tenellus]